MWGNVADILETATNSDTYFWLCPNSDCDGQPHDRYNYNHARKEQRPPTGNFFVWVLQAGRGFGKSRTGSETLVQWVVDNPVTVDGSPTHWLAAGATIADAREVMGRGPSGLVAALDRRNIEFVYNQSLGVITIAGTGQRIFLRGGDDDDLGRGLNLAGCWADEMGTWRRAMSAWTEGMVPALRQKLPNSRPHVVITSTPKPGQGAELLKSLLARDDGSVIVTTGSTFANVANLSEEAINEMKARYPEGSRLYRQELLGEIVESNEGALWNHETLDVTRVGEAPDGLVRVVVGVDPAVSYGPDSDLTGIVVVGCSNFGANRHFYVLEDATLRGTPNEWAMTALEMAEKWSADALVAEVNQGGAMVTSVIQQAGRDMQARGRLGVVPRITTVRASRGKATRAEPIAALTEQGRLHMVGALPALEAEMCDWVPGVSRKSPDRVDSLVWAVTSLMGASARRSGAF